METDEKYQQYMEFQQLQQQIEMMSKQMEEVNQQLMELEISKNALEEVEKCDKGTEILAQIANGIFVKTKLDCNQKLVVNVGADTTVEKSIPDVIKMLDEQQEMVKNNAKEIEKVIDSLGEEAVKKIQGFEAEQQSETTESKDSDKS